MSSKITNLKLLFTSFNKAHDDYHDTLSDDEAIDKSESYYFTEQDKYIRTLDKAKHIMCKTSSMNKMPDVNDVSDADNMSIKDLLSVINTLRSRQNGRYFPDDIFKFIFMNENVWISIEISLKFVPEGPINNIPALVQIMAWRRSGDKSLSEPVMV